MTWWLTSGFSAGKSFVRFLFPALEHTPQYARRTVLHALSKHKEAVKVL